MAKIGDFVTAKTLTGEIRQGVLVGWKGVTAIVRGILSTYLCEAHMTTVPDSNIAIPSTRAFVGEQRKLLRYFNKID